MDLSQLSPTHLPSKDLFYYVHTCAIMLKLSVTLWHISNTANTITITVALKPTQRLRMGLTPWLHRVFYLLKCRNKCVQPAWEDANLHLVYAVAMKWYTLCRVDQPIHVSIYLSLLTRVFGWQTVPWHASIRSVKSNCRHRCRSCGTSPNKSKRVMMSTIKLLWNSGSPEQRPKYFPREASPLRFAVFEGKKGARSSRFWWWQWSKWTILLASCMVIPCQWLRLCSDAFSVAKALEYPL